MNTNNTGLIGQKVKHSLLGEGTIIRDDFPFLKIVFPGAKKNPIKSILAISLLENIFTELENKSAIKTYLKGKNVLEDKPARESDIKEISEEEINKQEEILKTQKLIHEKIGWIVEDTSLLIKKISGIKALLSSPPCPPKISDSL